MVASCKIALTAGEPSGDALGAALMHAIGDRTQAKFVGVGGPLMAQAGLRSWFDMSEIAVMGAIDVLRSLPRLLGRIRHTAQQIIDDPDIDILVLIDAQDFSKRIAKRVRAKRPDLPIVLYVAPTVWVWRPGRAQKIKPYIGHLLALFPHEPEWFRRLDGPLCHFVGHPLTSELRFRNAHTSSTPPTFLMMPGSRNGELDRHIGIMEKTVQELVRLDLEFDVAIPTLPEFETRLKNETAHWPINVQIITQQAQKDDAMNRAAAALVVVGTATLELGLRGLPMVIIYQADGIMRHLGFMFTTPYFGLPNIILNKRGCPEYLNKNINPEQLALDLKSLLLQQGAYEEQRAFLANLSEAMRLENDKKPAAEAADIVLRILNKKVVSGR